MGFIKSLSLRSFRNYREESIELSPGIVVLEGENGQGKTSFLEAIYFLSLLRSFRSKQIQNLKNWQSDHFAISAYLEEEDGFLNQLEVNYGQIRQLKVNRELIKRSSDFIRSINAVSFVPEDIKIVKGSASDRRQFIDILLSQLYPNYLSALQNYNKALKSRNSLLRDKRPDRMISRSFEQPMAHYGALILYYRDELFSRMKPYVEQFSKDLFDDQRVELSYLACSFKDSLSDITAIEQRLLQSFEDSWSKDCYRQQTQIGPQRDDFNIDLNSQSLREFGSEGQCRLASLLLKMTAAQLLIDQQNLENVVLLIDDVLGELDQSKKESFLRTISRGDQVFIACTELPEYCKTMPHQKIRVEEGSLSLID